MPSAADRPGIQQCGQAPGPHETRNGACRDHSGTLGPARRGFLPNLRSITHLSRPGPPLAWVRTYRSMKPLSSGHGPGWDFSYNIWIEALPSSAGASASRVVIHDGGGRADTFYRQADGTYRCEGMFREGRFTGETFTPHLRRQGHLDFQAVRQFAVRRQNRGHHRPQWGRSHLCLRVRHRPARFCERFVCAGARSLNVVWDADGFITSVADSSGRSVHFTPYGAADADGSEGDLKSASCPQIGGTPAGLRCHGLHLFHWEFRPQPQSQPAERHLWRGTLVKGVRLLGAKRPAPP